jgi:cystathionine beta-lyase/cystathionine gamma-synthase
MTPERSASSHTTPPSRRWLALATIVAALAGLPAVGQAQLRVVVHKSYREADVSLRELTRLYRGEYGSLANGQRAILAEQNGVRARYVRTLTGMDDDQFRRHWIRLVFAGTPVQPPRGFSDVDAVCEFVARTPGALAIIDGRCDDGVRTLTINGHPSADGQYPLR